MTEEEFIKEIEQFDQWMKETITFPDLTGNKDEDRKRVLNDLSNLANKNSDIYEAHVEFHLTNGETIKVCNRCVKSYSHNRYVGDNIYFSDGWLYVDHTDDYNVYHMSRIKPESICWIDSYSIDIVWDINKEYILTILGLK